MTLHFSLSANDFLQHQLFAASMSERIRLKKLRSQLTLTLGFIAAGILFVFAGNNFMMYCSFFVAAATLLFYPAFVRKQYKRHYEAFIHEAYKNRINKPVTVKFEEDHLESLDEGGESKILLSQSEEIFETGEYFFLRFKSGETLILPKQKLPDPSAVKDLLRDLALQQNISYTEYPGWRWK